MLGTAEIVRFAVARRTKAINYVSTAAVLRTTQRSAGYAFSKWMSEKLLRDLHDRLGVPVRIYRPSWIMAHSRYLGQINARDTFTRLLQGIVTTSIAPRSFYAEGRSAEGAYYDGLPVDVVARSVASLATAAIDRARYVEYQIATSHHDVSLDVIVDWVRSAGYRVDQIDDYAAWYQLFRDRLGSLDRSARRLSLLPLFHTWERPKRGRRIDADTSGFDRHLARALRPEGTGQLAPIPRITEAFVHKGLSDMRALGLIHEPGDVRRFTT